MSRKPVPKSAGLGGCKAPEKPAPITEPVPPPSRDPLDEEYIRAKRVLDKLQKDGGAKRFRHAFPHAQEKLDAARAALVNAGKPLPRVPPHRN